MTGARASRIGAALLVGVLVAGCSGASDDGDPAAAPGPQEPGSVAADPTQSESSGLVLSEVGFAPADGNEPFVEIANAGDEPLDLANLRLVAGGRPVDVPAAEPALDPGARLLVTLEGELDEREGTVLLSEDEELLDSVTWGGQGGSVSLVVGDFVPATIEPGSTIARPPGADRPQTPTDWVLYPPAAASPGEDNPVPPVTSLLPVEGAILAKADTTLSWYPVPGAASYRVQVATDESFAEPVVDETVAEPTIDVGSLAGGTYLYRVQAVGSDGSTSAPVSMRGFSLVRTARAEDSRASPDLTVELNVKQMTQHKDTSMLQLEQFNETGPRAWDAPHQPHGDDPADAMNCAIAMITMINNFYGGDLSQDRIGFEIFKDRQPGPEEDLNWGYGLTAYDPATKPPGRVDETLEAFTFALGAPVSFSYGHASFDDVWDTVTNSVNDGRPVAGASEHHGWVVRGYTIRADGHRLLNVVDPARGAPYSVDLDSGRGNAAEVSLWVMPEHVNARKQEPGITKDSDGDKVVDFDETVRFHTDPNKKDSDGDRVPDQRDIASGVFDSVFGYAFGGRHGRDYDSDGVPSELDPDSDQGGCSDGDEDANRDGHQTGEETWNFNSKDDICGDLSGTITWTLDQSRTGPGDEQASSHDVVTLSVRFDEKDGEWVDAGSSYTWNGSSQLDTNPGNDPEKGYCNEAHHTSTTTGSGEFEGSLASSIFVDVVRDTDEVYVSSWVEGELRTHKESGTLMSDGGPTQWCELVPSDSTQGGGSTIDSAAEWGQIPRCSNSDEAIQGTISNDGETATFDCDSTETYEPTEGSSATETMTVTGRLTFANRN